VKEPLFHIVKKDTMVWWKLWLVRLCAIVAALLVSALFTVLMTGMNPLKVFGSLVNGAVGTSRRRWMLFQNSAILLCIALAVTPAFKMKFWNTGAEGQVLAGGMATAACMLLGNELPPLLLFPLMILSSILAGMIWGVIPALFKAKWNTNETLFTLMMNYVAMKVVNFFSQKWAMPKGSGKIGVINNSDHIGWLPNILGQSYLINILIVVGITVFIYIYMKYSKHGYEIAVVGESENTARYIGINVKRVIVRTMILSGALCGIAGFLLVAGIDHTIASDTAGGDGFTAIMVSWIAQFNPLTMVLVAILITFLSRGAGQISSELGLNSSFADVLTGIIILFIIGSEFFANYEIIFRHKKKEAAV